MKVNITIPKPNKGRFSEIKLGYDLEDEKIEVLLNIDFKNLYMFTRRQTGIDFDVFLIGCFVYGIDILLPREKFSNNGWNREIEVEFPVENPDIFNQGKYILQETLSFLTGDDWQISFIKREVARLYIAKSRSEPYPQMYRQSHKKVSLFSGGLDSLIGIIDMLASSKDRLVLVSHYDSQFKGAKSDQDSIIEILANKYKHYHILQTRVDLSAYDMNANKIERETTLRARSFLFLCQAIFVAHSIEEDNEVLIPENGTISLNHPLTPSRRSSCSTRTAHPYYLNKVEEFIKSIGLNHAIRNKYAMQTKGEMLEGCLDKDILQRTYKLSCSCAKRGTRKDIRDVSRGTNHCGICMPCIYRRVALHKIGIDTEIIGTDLFNPIKYPLDKLPDVPAFLDYLKQPLTIEDIEKNLLVNGTLPFEKIGEYADVVYRTRNEIREWICEKGSTEIKRILGIR